VGVIAALAGTDALRVLCLSVSMLAIQAAIGAANDWADAPADATSRPTKPIPAGLVARSFAARVDVAAGALGLALAAVLAIASALADPERDAGAGIETIATAIRIAVARRIGALLQVVVAGGAVLSAIALGGDAVGITVVVAGAALIAAGVAAGWGTSPTARQRA
jgi:4-hydroxybenzoate polyprenyltransferase